MKFNDLITLSPGTIMEGGTLIPSVTLEPLVYRVVQSSPEEVLMDMLFMDIPVGRVLAKKGGTGNIKLGVVPK